MVVKRPYVLMILDGWGIGKKEPCNAVHLANTPFLDSVKREYPTAELICSGADVGLPSGVMGNSEVGHLNIGAGRVVYQDLLRIDRAIEDKSFYNNLKLNNILNDTLSIDSSLHLIGLLSDGGVHSHINHLYALLKLAKSKNIKNIFIHVILDGRDTPPDRGIEYIKQLKTYLDKLGCGSISTICGRYYAMDRDQRWDRIEKAYKLYTEGIGRFEEDPIEAVKLAYLRKERDEFIRPIVIKNNNSKSLSIMKDNDTVIFFNFRADRAREISFALTQPNFHHFKRTILPNFFKYLTMTLYDKNLKLESIFSPFKILDLMGGVISSKGLTQLRLAETEKYAHVTYFFNGGNEAPFLNEDRFLVKSPRDVDTYDQKPEMSAWTIVQEAIKRIDLDKYDFLVINFANMDMVGHTGVLNAAIKACETVDQCVKKIVLKILLKGGTAIITADHGNAEKMFDTEGKPFTSHTKNKVPISIVANHLITRKLNNGTLGDIAPTILDIMGIKKPDLMTGVSLLKL